MERNTKSRIRLFVCILFFYSSISLYPLVILQWIFGRRPQVLVDRTARAPRVSFDRNPVIRVSDLIGQQLRRNNTLPSSAYSAAKIKTLTLNEIHLFECLFSIMVRRCAVTPKRAATPQCLPVAFVPLHFVSHLYTRSLLMRIRLITSTKSKGLTVWGFFAVVNIRVVRILCSASSFEKVRLSSGHNGQQLPITFFFFCCSDNNLHSKFGFFYVSKNNVHLYEFI